MMNYRFMAVGFAAFLLCLIFFADRAHADEATEARFHFQRGVSLISKGKVQSALEQFLISNRLVKNPNAVFNAAKCFEHMKNYNEAYALYSEYLQFNLTPAERIEGEKKLKEVEGKVAAVTISTFPEGAEIFIDRKELGSWGMTPRLIAVPPGEHEVFLEYKGHYVESFKIKAELGEMKNFHADLKAKTGSVKISGPHEIVYLTIDAAESQTIDIPAEFDLPVGEHTLKFEADGYLPDEKQVTVKENKLEEVDFKLDAIPEPEGSLSIVSTPSAALVMLDKMNFGFTPLMQPVSVGQHTVRVTMEGRESWKGDIDISVADNLHLDVDLVQARFLKKQKQGLIALFTLGSLFFLGGAASGVYAIYTKQEFENNPTVELQDRGNRLNLFADIGVILGGAALIAGGIWYYFIKRKQDTGSKAKITLNKANQAKEHEAFPPEGESKLE
ncbi:MAG: PEGA domain-containing protein [Pseudomonadota bacterium]